MYIKTSFFHFIVSWWSLWCVVPVIVVLQLNEGKRCTYGVMMGIFSHHRTKIHYFGTSAHNYHCA